MLEKETTAAEAIELVLKQVEALSNSWTSQ
jgi:hypothetical protein